MSFPLIQIFFTLLALLTWRFAAAAFDASARQLEIRKHYNTRALGNTAKDVTASLSAHTGETKLLKFSVEPNEAQPVEVQTESKGSSQITVVSATNDSLVLSLTPYKSLDFAKYGNDHRQTHSSKAAARIKLVRGAAYSLSESTNGDNPNFPEHHEAIFFLSYQ